MAFFIWISAKRKFKQAVICRSVCEICT